MIGLDAVGPLLVLFAIALMSVAPLQLTIARSKANAAWLGAMAGEARDGTPPAPGRETAAGSTGSACAGDAAIRAAAESPGTFDTI